MVNKIVRNVRSVVEINKFPIRGAAVLMVASLFFLWLLAKLFGNYFGIDVSLVLGPALNLLVVLSSVVFLYKMLDDTKGTTFREAALVIVVVLFNLFEINVIATSLIPELHNPIVMSVLGGP